LTLSSSDFKGLYTKNDGDEIGYVAIVGSNLKVGTLQLSGSDYKSGTQISVSDLDNLTFETAASGTVSYNVKAYTISDKSVSVGTAVLTISVTTLSVPNISSTISKSVSVGDSISLSASTFTGSSDVSTALQDVEITPTNSNYGTWYLGTTAFTGKQEVSASDLGILSFTGSAVGKATFKWRVSNGVGYSEYGTGTIDVSSPELKLTSSTDSSYVLKGELHIFNSSQFKYTPAAASITYVKINTIPISGDGYLYLTTDLAKNTTNGYAAISANKALTKGAVIPENYLRYLRLSTNSTSKNDSVSFTWTATTETTIVKTTVWATEATYTINFKEMEKIHYSGDVNTPLALNSSDFVSKYSDATGNTLSYVTFTPPKSTYGNLYFNYDATTKKGTTVSTSTKYYKTASPNLSNITFVPKTDYVGTVTTTYNAYGIDGTFVTGTLEIEISNRPGGTISYTTDKDTAIKLDASDFKTAFDNATGKDLEYVKFTLPSSSYGKLYYNYTSSTNYDSVVSASTKYNMYESPYLSYITFVPYDDFTGTVDITYTGYTENGTSYRGKFKVVVETSPAGIVTYSVKTNGNVKLSGDDFSSQFIEMTGSELSYIQLSAVKPAVGTFYYKYDSTASTGTTSTGTTSTGTKATTSIGAKVTTSTKYYNGGTSDISDITFVPATGLSDTVIIPFTAYTSAGVAYAGKLKIIIGETSGGTINYTTGLNTAMQFDANSFKTAFLTQTDTALSYVKFTLPSISNGKLYYNYTSPSSYSSLVSVDTKYYAGTSPSLSDITFVPYSGYSGTFTISYTGYNATGTSFTGKIKITVSNANGTTVSYSTEKNANVVLDADDFNTAFYNLMDAKLYYVKFTLPSSSYGKLYYNYASDTSYGSAVTASSKYYRNASPNISDLTFVPYNGYTGRVVISYTGYDTEGNDMTGSLIITVKDKTISTINYTTTKNNPVTFEAYDFMTKFVQETDTSLYSVKFVLPTISYGKLYYDYVSPANPGSLVTNGGRYYRDEMPYLNDVTFVPFANYVGDITIDYVAYTSGGVAYDGEIVITVNEPAVSGSFTDIDHYPWASDAIKYLYNGKVVNGTGDSKFSPQNNVSRGDFMLMICNAFSLKATDSATNFPDVTEGSYYYDAILAARSLNITVGSGGKYHPNDAISRQDAMVIIVNVLKVAGKKVTVGDTKDLSAFTDSGDVSTYAEGAVATLVKAGIVSGSNGKLNPKGNITRAEMAVILYSILTSV